MSLSVRDRFEGCLIGAAVGDAVGFLCQLQGIPSDDDLRQRRRPIDLQSFQFVEHPPFPAGQYTDDTQMTLSLAHSLLRMGGVNGEDIANSFAELWKRDEIVYPGMSCTQSMLAFMQGVDWETCGTRPGMAGNGTAMRIAPLGLWFYDRPKELPKACRIASIITHRDNRCTTGALIVAGTVAYLIAVQGGCYEGWLYHILKLIEPYDKHKVFVPWVCGLDDLLSANYHEALEQIIDAGLPEGDRQTERVVSGFIVSTVLASLFFYWRHPDSYAQAIEAAIAAGGDIDTTAAIVGAISGAAHGVEQVPSHLIENLQNADSIQRTAAGLLEAKPTLG